MILHEWLDQDVYGGGVVLPQITDERLEELLKQITPLVRRDGGQLYERGPSPEDDEGRRRFYRGTSMVYDPPKGPRRGFRAKLAIVTNHGTGYHGFFKPSVAEVLAFVPAGLPTSIDAFYIRDNKVGIYRHGDGHRAEAVFGEVVEDFLPDAVIKAIGSCRTGEDRPVQLRRMLIEAADNERTGVELPEWRKGLLDQNLVDFMHLSYPEVTRIAKALSDDLEVSFTTAEIGNAGSYRTMLALARARLDQASVAGDDLEAVEDAAAGEDRSPGG